MPEFVYPVLHMDSAFVLGPESPPAERSLLSSSRLLFCAVPQDVHALLQRRLPVSCSLLQLSVPALRDALALNRSASAVHIDPARLPARAHVLLLPLPLSLVRSGVHALTRIPIDDTVLYVPLKYIMTSEVAKASDICKKILAAVSLRAFVLRGALLSWPSRSLRLLALSHTRSLLPVGALHTHCSLLFPCCSHRLISSLLSYRAWTFAASTRTWPATCCRFAFFPSSICVCRFERLAGRSPLRVPRRLLRLAPMCPALVAVATG